MSFAGEHLLFRPIAWESGVVEVGRCYSRREIHDRLGGSLRSYLPTVGGKVVCACVTREINPGAPLTILVGNGPVIERSAKAFAALATPVPVFIKRDDHEWEYVSDFRAHPY